MLEGSQGVLGQVSIRQEPQPVRVGGKTRITDVDLKLIMTQKRGIRRYWTLGSVGLPLCRVRNWESKICFH